MMKLMNRSMLVLSLKLLTAETSSGTCELHVILILLTKDATPTSNFQPVRLLDLDSCHIFTYSMADSANPDQLASSEGIYTVCKGRAYPGSAGQGLNIVNI